jgi:serine/threonine-protein kinase
MTKRRKPGGAGPPDGGAHGPSGGGASGPAEPDDETVIRPQGGDLSDLDVEAVDDQDEIDFAEEEDDEGDFGDSTALVDPAEYMRSLRDRESERKEHRAEIASALPHLGEVKLPVRLGDYTLTELLGLGGMAEVFLAKQEGISGFEKTLVVKRIHPHLSQDEKFKTMFVREARVAAGLHHRNIVQLYELGQDRGIYFMAMEFVDGLTLLKLARRAWRAGLSLPMELAVSAAADAANGLHHAHTFKDEEGNPRNIVHRDISPDNLMINRQGLTKLLDFGVAKAADSVNVTRAGEVKGKIPYMAPEQLHGKPIDGRADLYSLGATLYWLLTGRRPFHADGDVQLMQEIAYSDAARPSEFNPEIPEPIEQIIMRLLSKDPDERFANGEELSDALFQFLPPQRREVSAFVEEALQLEDQDDSGPISTASFVAATPRTAHFITTSRRLANFLPNKDAAKKEDPFKDEPTSIGADDSLSIEDRVGAAIADALEIDEAPPAELISDEVVTSPDAMVDSAIAPGAQPLAFMPEQPDATKAAAIDIAQSPVATGAPLAASKSKRVVAIAAAAAIALVLVLVLALSGGEDGANPVLPPPDPDQPVVAVKPPADAPADAPDDKPADEPGDAPGDDGWDFGDAEPGSDGTAKPADEAPPAQTPPAQTPPAETPPTETTPPQTPPEASDKPAIEPVPQPTAPSLKSVKARGPKYVRWTSPRGSRLGAGNTTFAVPVKAKSVIAIDTRRGVKTRVPLRGGSVDYAKAPKGTLDIRAFPFAKVTVGKSVLGTTPFKPMTVPAGTYRLKLEHKGKVKKQTVTVSPGGTAKVRANMTE